MSLNECFASIRNLEGIIDFESCIYFAGKTLESLPSSFFELNTLKEGEDHSEYSNSIFYKERPWEIPKELEKYEKRIVPYLSVHDLDTLEKTPIFIDLRSPSE